MKKSSVRFRKSKVQTQMKNLLHQLRQMKILKATEEKKFSLKEVSCKRHREDTTESEGEAESVSEGEDSDVRDLEGVHSCHLYTIICRTPEEIKKPEDDKRSSDRIRDARSNCQTRRTATSRSD